MLDTVLRAAEQVEPEHLRDGEWIDDRLLYRSTGNSHGIATWRHNASVSAIHVHVLYSNMPCIEDLVTGWLHAINTADMNERERSLSGHTYIYTYPQPTYT